MQRPHFPYCVKPGIYAHSVFNSDLHILFKVTAFQSAVPVLEVEMCSPDSLRQLS